MAATYRLEALKQAASATASAVIVAAGTASRMGAMSERKPFLLLDGRTVLEIACAAFDAARSVTEIVIVAHGRWYEKDGAAELRRAFRWIL